mgnify:CR=1 FL=1
MDFSRISTIVFSNSKSYWILDTSLKDVRCTQSQESWFGKITLQDCSSQWVIQSCIWMRESGKSEKSLGNTLWDSFPGNGKNIKEIKEPARIETITLDRFCAIFLNPESVSTNRLHKIMLAHSAMEVVSHMLTDHQFKLCMQFIGNDFNPSCLDNSTVEIKIATDLNVN